MARWKLTLAYDGTPYHGWQVQPGLCTVQGTLARALQRLTGEQVLPQGSGRTDAGVHALGQVASFDLTAPLPERNLLRALNRSLPASIRVLSAEHAQPGFHARHSAVSKQYEYRIFAAREGGIWPPAICPPMTAPCPPMTAPYVWDCAWPLALDRLQAAAAQVLGEHDFTSFAASDPDSSARALAMGRQDGFAEAHEQEPPGRTRTVLKSEWQQDGSYLVYRVAGTGFLHHMVRNLVGTFVECGRGRWEPERVTGILAACNRSEAGPTAPARGLFLHSVHYGDPGLPQQGGQR